MLVRMKHFPRITSVLDDVMSEQFFFPRYERIAPQSSFPQVYFKESENELLLAAELPGMKKEQIAINIEKNQLTISGERKAPESKEKEEWLRSEIFYGSFSRTFQLPFSINQDQISAQYTDGVLKITLPKAESAKPKTISIS